MIKIRKEVKFLLNNMKARSALMFVQTTAKLLRT